jgi:hypothetical protein
MMLRTGFACVAVALFVSSAPAQTPKPIRLWLSPAKPPTPALRYQLLPDARVATSGNAADVYHQVIDLLAKKPLGSDAMTLYEWHELPLNRLPKDDVRKTLAFFDEVYDLLAKAARCDHCDWGVRERLREKGIGALLPEVQPMRECALLLSLRARLEMAEGHNDQALATLRSGFALGRNIGEGETLIHFLVGVAITAIMEGQLDRFISLPDAPNLYYALTDLPMPYMSMRKGLEGERISIYATFPTLRDAATNLDAGPLAEKDLAMCVKMLAGLSKGNEVLPPALDRFYMGWNIKNRHEIAKKALIDAGRPRDKVEAMPHVQVAFLHALLEYDAALDNFIVWQNLPDWELYDRMNTVNKRYVEDRWKNPTAAAVPLVPLVIPSIKRVAFARVRMDRKFALLRTLEAIRLYAANHDGQLPRSLAAIKDVPLPLDPATGKSFEYELAGDIAKVRGPVPAGQTPLGVNNYLAYELKIRK